MSEPLAEKLIRERSKLQIGSRWSLRRADALAYIARNLRIRKRPSDHRVDA